MQYKRTLVLPMFVMIFILTGCFRQASDTFEAVGSQNTGATTISNPTQIPVVNPSPTAEIIDPNATDVLVTADSASVEASETPRTIIQPTEDQSAVVATDVPTATVVIPTSTPQVIPTATEPTFITPQVVEEVTQPSATPTEVVEEPTLQPTPTAIGAASIGDCDYEIQSGDNLFRISLNNDVALADLLRANGLTEASIIIPGQILTIPNCDSSDADTVEEEDSETEEEVLVLDSCEYEIQAGDTLFALSQEFDVTLATLLAENGLVENAIIQPGQVLEIPGCVETASDDDSASVFNADASSVDAESTEEAMPEQTIHTIASGDSLITIARRYGVTVTDIIEANVIPDPNNLTVGQELIIPDN